MIWRSGSFSFLLIVLAVAACSKRDSNTGLHTIHVAIQPFENMDPDLTDSVAMTLRDAYGVKTIVLPHIPLPSGAFINVKAPRYRADSLLRHLMSIKPDSADYIIGVTHQDVSTTKRDASGNIKSPKEKYTDWGVMGLGYRPGPACVISTFRIAHASKKKLLERLKKISIHELGHNLGLDHCKTSRCVMQDAAETIKTIDAARAQLCAECREKI